MNGLIPVSALPDMWGRFWGKLYKDVVPYPARPNLDVSDNMRMQNYTAAKIFTTADDFYAGMGLPRVPKSFWSLSMLEKPNDGRRVICHPTAWDFYDGKVGQFEFSNSRIFNRISYIFLYFEI